MKTQKPALHRTLYDASALWQDNLFIHLCLKQHRLYNHGFFYSGMSPCRALDRPVEASSPEIVKRFLRGASRLSTNDQRRVKVLYGSLELCPKVNAEITMAQNMSKRTYPQFASVAVATPCPSTSPFLFRSVEFPALHSQLRTASTMQSQSGKGLCRPQLTTTSGAHAVKQYEATAMP